MTKHAARNQGQRNHASSPEQPPSLLEAFFPLCSLCFGGQFLGIALLVAGDYFNGYVTGVLYFLGSIALVVQYKNRSDFLRVGLSSAVLLAVALSVLLALSDLASNGSLGPDHSSATALHTEKALAVGVLWLVLGIPNRGFKLEIDRDGHGQARSVVARACAIGASALTAIYIFLSHAGEGPLSKVSTGALAVGTVFTVFLLMPAYRSIATRCWERGFGRVLWMDDLDTRLRQAAAEIAEGQRRWAEGFLRERGAAPTKEKRVEDEHHDSAGHRARKHKPRRRKRRKRA